MHQIDSNRLMAESKGDVRSQSFASEIIQADSNLFEND